MDTERLLKILEKLGLLEKSFLPSHRKYIKILCPFHDETEPSCSIVLEDGYKARPIGFTNCFSCGKKFRNYMHLLSALSEHPEFKDKLYQMPHIAERSFAAPLYFGQIVDRDTRMVYSDGGIGNSFSFTYFGLNLPPNCDSNLSLNSGCSDKADRRCM